jgi:hypothetical protein
MGCLLPLVDYLPIADTYPITIVLEVHSLGSFEFFPVFPIQPSLTKGNAIIKKVLDHSYKNPEEVIQ